MKTLITAHNGADNTPGNSTAFLSYALSSAADITEIDVRRGAGDDGLVLSHDEDVSAPVSLRTAFQMLGEHPAARMNCDLKEDGLEADVYALACALLVKDRILYSGSVSTERLRDAGLAGKVEVYFNIEEAVPELKEWRKKAEQTGEMPEMTAAERLAFADRACAACREAGIRTLNIPKEFADASLIAHVHAQGMALSIWTVNDAQEAAFFLSQGVQNITTRRLSLLLAQRDAV